MRNLKLKKVVKFLMNIQNLRILKQEAKYKLNI